MIYARLGVAGAILCTMYFNGSYAWSKGGDPTNQIALVALAVSIDLCKCGCLPAASHLWHHRRWLAAVVLFLLWPLTFVYSTYAGYAAITTNRSAASATGEGQAGQRARAQAAYDQATADLATAKASPLWNATAACTVPKTSPQRTFCDGVDSTKSDQTAAALKLDGGKPVHVDAELTVLSDYTRLPLATLILIIGLVPALILELVSSLGLYAVTNNRPAGSPGRRVNRFSISWPIRARTIAKNSPATAPAASDRSQVPTVTVPEGQPPQIKWKIPAAPVNPVA